LAALDLSGLGQDSRIDLPANTLGILSHRRIQAENSDPGTGGLGSTVGKEEFGLYFSLRQVVCFQHDVLEPTPAAWNGQARQIAGA
jgi:hypothetical protein